MTEHLWNDITIKFGNNLFSKVWKCKYCSMYKYKSYEKTDAIFSFRRNSYEQVSYMSCNEVKMREIML